MLDLTANRWLLMLSLFCFILTALRELLNRWRSSVYYVLDLLAMLVPLYCLRSFICADISAVTVCCFLFTVQKFACLCDIMYVCRRGFYMMNKSTVAVYADMSFVAKMPCFPLFRWMSFGITFLLLVLRRRWRFNNRRIYNRSFFQDQSSVCQNL